MSAHKHYGMYRGVVTGFDDPTRLKRVRVSVPRLLGSASVWAFPCLPSPSSEAPTVKLGQGVWVMFEGGDLGYPVYVGFFGEPPS